MLQLSGVCLVMLLAAVAGVESDVGFDETFVMTSNRPKFLEALAPGSTEYNHYALIEAQNKGDINSSSYKQLLESFKSKREGSSWIVRDTLLRGNLDAISEMIGLDLKTDSKEQPSYAKSSTTYSEKIALVTGPNLYRETFQKFDDSFGDDWPFTAGALPYLFEENLGYKSERAALDALTRPYPKNLVEVIVKHHYSVKGPMFGAAPIHAQLTLKQLIRLEKEMNVEGGFNCKNSELWVTSYLARLAPSGDVDLSRDDNARQAYFDALWDFAATKVGASLNALRIHVMYAVLENDFNRGKPSEERLLEYLAIPKYSRLSNMDYVNRKEFDGVRTSVSHGMRTPLPMVSTRLSDDHDLIRKYLLFFLREPSSSKKTFEKYVESSYLQDVFAEARLLAGAGDVEKLAQSLSSEARLKELRERVDIEFAPENPKVFAPADVPTLLVDVKNVERLVVKVFRINAETYYQTKKTEVDTAINLDGLTAQHERVLEFSDPPLHRVRRTIKLEELGGASGLYVVELIGNGKSSRVLMHRGSLRAVSRITGAGHVFVVVDQDHVPQANATLWLDGHLFVSGSGGSKPGEILVPFTHTAGGQASQVIVLRSGDLCSLDRFHHMAEEYSLVGGFFGDRGSMVAGRKCGFALRAGLFCSGVPVPIGLMTEGTVEVQIVDSDGVPSSLKVNVGKLGDDGEFVHEVKIPERTRTIQLRLTGKVKVVSTGASVDVSVETSFSINGNDNTDQVDDLHLRKLGNGVYGLSMLGKSGEAKSGVDLSVTVRDRYCSRSVTGWVKTDEHGVARVSGVGATASQISVAGGGGSGRGWSWNLWRESTNTYPTRIHASAGTDIQIPHASETPAYLFELRNKQYYDDVSSRIRTGEPRGYLVLGALPPGDFELFLPAEGASGAGHSIQILVSAGDIVHGHVLSRTRMLELAPQQRTQIVSAVDDVKGNVIRIKVGNPGPRTRVHVVASHFFPVFDSYQHLSAVQPKDPGYAVYGSRASLYVSGRKLGEEYRYVLDRRYAEKRAGNMLKRPRLLLNPYAVRSTETTKQEAQEGEKYAALQNSSGERYRGATASRAMMSAQPSQNIDFLAEGSHVLFNLRPDRDGNVVVSRDIATHGRTLVSIVAVDVDSSAGATLVIKDKDTDSEAAGVSGGKADKGLGLPSAYRDTRLLNGLAADKHYAETKAISGIGADVSNSNSSSSGSGGDNELVFGDIATTDLEVIDTVGRVHGLYMTLSGSNPTLREFGFVSGWDKLSAAEKEDKYSQYACHELSFFVFARDPEFFARVVRPYLSHKRDKTFMDHFLLSDDLTMYLSPYEWSRLNTVERILLGSKYPDVRAEVARALRDKEKVSAKNYDVVGRIFSIIIKAKALETGDDLGFAAAKDQEIRTREEARDIGMESYGLASESEECDDIMPCAAPPPPPGGAPMMMMRAMAPEMAMPMASLARMDKLEEKSLRLSDQSRSFSKKKASIRVAETKELMAQDLDMMLGDDEAGGSFFAEDNVEQLEQARASVKQFFKPKDKTMEYAENNYYKLPVTQQNADLIVPNAFWADFAEYMMVPAEHGAEGAATKGKFLSSNFGVATRNFSEMMLALSVLGVPFSVPSGAVATKFDGPKMVLSSRSPAIVVHKQIKEAPTVRSDILITQNIFDPSDRVMQDADGQSVEKYVEELLRFKAYGCRVIVTNVSTRVYNLEVLLQIPEGAIAVTNGFQTRSRAVELRPYATEKLEYFFYFPKTGVYRHFPVHAVLRSTVVAFVAGRAVNVVEKPTIVDKTSWSYVSQEGTEAEVLEYLRTQNLQNIALDRIAWRARTSNKEFFRAVLDILRRRRMYVRNLWKYGFAHGDMQAVTELLPFEGRVSGSVGPYFASELFVYDALQRRDYNHLEYDPLVNARVHRLGQERKILNDCFAAHYAEFLRYLSYRPALSGDDLLSLSYYLLLQDRDDEAYTVFKRVVPPTPQTTKFCPLFNSMAPLGDDCSAVFASTPATIQYDYMLAYFAFSGLEDLRIARQVADRYRDYPVPRWRNLFKELGDQLTELGVGPSVVVSKEGADGSWEPISSASVNAQAVSREPTFDFYVDNKQIHISHQNIRGELLVNLYVMDIELLFSTSPFMQQGSSEQFSFVYPNVALRVNAAADAESAGPLGAMGKTTVAIPEALLRSNLLIEVTNGASKKTASHFANSLAVMVYESYGQLKVVDSSSGKALSSAYVKVYGRQRGGEAKFYKDGYTDLRGKFDYVSLDTSDLDNVDRFAILVTTADHGAVIREAAPPKQ